MALYYTLGAQSFSIRKRSEDQGREVKECEGMFYRLGISSGLHFPWSSECGHIRGFDPIVRNKRESRFIHNSRVEAPTTIIRVEDFIAKKDAEYPEDPGTQCMQPRPGLSYDQSRELRVRLD